MDKLTSKQRSLVMSRNQSRDTLPERMLRLALWHHGLRYRKNDRRLPGTPDIALPRQHIAIFIDGDFWHAHHHEENPGEQIASNQAFWRKKLERNVERDKEVNAALTERGWLGLRFWESDIKQRLDEVVEQILSYATK